MNSEPCVYILASRRNGTLYIGVTSCLKRRVWEHKSNQNDGFTERYDVHQLVWYCRHDTMEAAIHQEKMLKKWRRQWKLELVEKLNPKWRDLYPDLL